jgi:hypothetical protein
MPGASSLQSNQREWNYRIMIRTCSFLVACLLALPAHAQIDCNAGLGDLDTAASSSLSPWGFIHDVAPKEAVFSKAFTGFGYLLGVSLQTLQGDAVDGEFSQVAKIDFDPAGVRRTTVVQGPVDTLTRVKLPNKDVDSLRDSFSITPDILADRDVVYTGRQKVGEINAAVFDILPRTEQANLRSFAGRVWVRASENAIIRVCGRVGSGPFGPVRYSVTRQKVADQYWFPETIGADENVQSDSNGVHVRITLKYSDYTPR